VLNTDPVVSDPQLHQPPNVFDPNRNRLRPRVLHAIRNGFLRDAIELGGDFAIVQGFREIPLQAHVNLV
jgi:hypothetical protein